MKHIRVLCRANCRNTLKLIREAAREDGVEIQLEMVEQVQDIVAYGVAVDGKLVHAVPSRDKIARWL